MFEVIVKKAREAGLAGATVLKGVLGYGATDHIRTTKILDLSADLSMVVEIVDEESKIQAFQPTLSELIEEANRAAEDIKRQAEMAIQHELAEAKLKLREDVANQAVIMAEELIRKNLQDADQVKLIEDYLAKVGTVQ